MLPRPKQAIKRGANVSGKRRDLGNANGRSEAVEGERLPAWVEQRLSLPRQLGQSILISYRCDLGNASGRFKAFEGDRVPRGLDQRLRLMPLVAHQEATPQQALPPDAATRRARSGDFERQNLTERFSGLSVRRR
jgi:hypothetical protein